MPLHPTAFVKAGETFAALRAEGGQREQAMSKKVRLDVLLVDRALAESRQKAQATIMCGLVFVNGQRVDKPGTAVAEDAAVEVRGQALRYVSRGGLKLEKAMAIWPIDLHGAVCMDVGASTGGFTDCMLQNGAAKVYAVDVGYGQLAWKQRNDPRVVCLERTNARYLAREQVPDPLDFASVDVSFISLKLILPPLAALLKSYPDMNVVVSQDGYGCPGIANYVESEGLQDRLVVVGIDDSPEILNYITSGALDCTIAQDFYTMGYESVYYIKNIMEGNAPAFANDSGTIVIGVDEVDEHMELLKERGLAD